MNTSDAQAVMRHLVQTFPALDWPDGVKADFARRLLQFQITSEQAEAVVMQVRFSSRAKCPAPRNFIEMLAECDRASRQGPAVRSDAPVYHPDDPPLTNWDRELAKRLRENPSHPCFTRLRSKPDLWNNTLERWERHGLVQGAPA